MAERLRITKQFDFHMAHALEGYEGACSHIHGHAYRLFVTLRGVALEDGMVMDFKKLKMLVQEKVLDYYDHSLLLKKTEKSMKLYPEILSGWGSVHLTDMQPTSENILMDIVERLSRVFPDNVQLFSIRLYETETSWAEWFADDNSIVLD